MQKIPTEEFISGWITTASTYEDAVTQEVLLLRLRGCS